MNNWCFPNRAAQHPNGDFPVGSIRSRRNRALPTILHISGVATMSTPMFNVAAPAKSLSWT